MPYTAIKNPLDVDPAVAEAFINDGKSEFRKGWDAAGLSEEVNATYEAANQAELDGRHDVAKVLKAQAKDLGLRAAVTSPRVQNLTDAQGVGGITDWALGSAGSLRSSVKPALTGLAGGIAGTVLAPFTGGVINPVTGSTLAATLASYPDERNEIIANAMQDSNTTGSAQDIRDKARAYGIPSALLNSVVLAGMGRIASGVGRSAFAQAVKSIEATALKDAEAVLARTGKEFGEAEVLEVAKGIAEKRVAQLAYKLEGEEIAKKGATSYIKSGMAKEGAEEFLTEGAQDVLGQAAQNELEGNTPLDKLDWKKTFNAAAAGALPGSLMGATSHAGSVARHKLGEGAEKVNEVRSDPVGKVADFAADAGSVVGKLAAKGVDWFERKISPEHNAYATLIGQGGSPEQHSAAALQWAQHVVNDPTASEVDRADASAFILDAGNPDAAQIYRDKLTIRHHAKLQEQGDTSIDDEINERTGESKASRMSARSSIEEGVTPQDGEFNYDSIQRAAAIAQAKGADTREPGITPVWDHEDKQRRKEVGAANYAKRQQQLEGVADIWRKQGVSEKLLAATDEKTDPSQRGMSIALLGWVQRGFKDVDGNVFVPNSLVKRYGKKTPEIINSLTKTAFQNGLIDHDVAQKAQEVSEMAQKAHLEATTIHDAILGAIPDYARSMYTREDISQLDEILRHVVKYGTNKEQEAGLLKVFGSKENIAQAMSKYEVEKSQYGKQLESTSTEDHESEINEDSAPRVTYHGWNRTTRPFNVSDDARRIALDKQLAKYTDDASVRASAIGAHDALIEQYGQGHDFQRQAENELLWDAVRKDDSTEAQKQQYIADIEALDEQQRGRMLKRFNRTHKVLRLEHVSSTDIADRIRPDQVNSFRETRKPGSIHVTPARGTIYLERKAKVNEETGEVVGKDEAFITSSYKLIKWAREVESKESEGATNERRSGVDEEYASLIRGLNALIESDGTFTGRIGFKMAPTQKGAWLREGDALPKSLRLNPGEGKEGHTVGLVRSREEWRGKNQSKSTEDTWDQEAGDQISDDRTGEKLPTDRNVTPSEHRGDKPIYRNSDGAQIGLQDDAIGAGYEGHAATSAAASEPIDAPLATKDSGVLKDATEAQRDALVKLETARDWVIASMANKEVYQKLLDAVSKMTKSQLEVLKYAVFGRTTKDPFETRKAVNKNRGKPVHAEFEITPTGDTHTTVKHDPGLLDMSGEKIGSLYFKGDTNRGKMRITRLNHYASDIQTAINNREEVLGNGLETTKGKVEGRGVENGEGGRASAGSATGQTASEGRADAGGRETRVAPRDARNAHNGEVAELDDAIYDESYGKLDTVDKLLALARRANQLNREFSQRDEAGETLSEREEGLWSMAGQLVFNAQSDLKNNSGIMDWESFFDGVDHTDADVKQFVKDLAGSKQSTQTADAKQTEATPEAVEAARQHVLNTLGDTVDVGTKPFFEDNSSGRWTPRQLRNLIELALNGDVLSTSFHESMHEFFSILRKSGNEATTKVLQRVAMNEIVNRKLERLLKDHPAAAAQVRNDPDEAAAFLYQFWLRGDIKLGPDTTTLFQRIKNLFNTIFKRVSKEALDEQHAELIMRAFTGGAFKSVNGDTAVREASLKLLKQQTERHEVALENVDKAWREFTRVYGRATFSAEAMMKATKNEHMVNICEGFNQEAGSAKKEQSLFEGIHQQNGIWMNKLKSILTAYSKEDLEIAREALSRGVMPTDRVAKQIVQAIHAFNDEIYEKYLTPRGVSRWDEESNKWVPVEKRKNYFTRVWDVDELQKRAPEFKARLLEVHAKELEALADTANKERAAYEADKRLYKQMGPAAKQAVEDGNTGPITADMVADAIVHRLLNSKGHVDLAETTSSIGLSPAATSVNRRTLSFIKDDDPVFESFKSKDIVNIMTSYVSSMVKRGEYTRVWGNGSERLAQQADSAILLEMGGKKLVQQANAAMPGVIKAWRKAKAAAIENKEEFTVPFPTLRSVGQRIHEKAVGSEKMQADMMQALKSLDQGFKAIMGLEGTLGASITTGQRGVISALAAYQTLRLLPMTLFSSMNDVMGIVANGGELHDAWDAFVAGMREIGLSWKGKESNDVRARRAEEWGTVDAGAVMDALGQTYGSVYMTQKMRRLSDSFFKWNGMEGWNRAMRITATAVAERALMEYKRDGYDTKDKAAVARFEELFGKGFDPKNIKVDADGNLDMHDATNQAAMMRWVTNAIMSPNAAQRPVWASDPRMAPFWMLKQFAYTFHRVMLKRVIEQAALGNLRPAMVLACGYAPVTIAAGAVKELLIPGDEPPWMKMGLGSYLSYGVSRAGIFGVPGMAYDALTSYTGPIVGGLGAIGGPTVSQMLSVPFDSAGKTVLGAAPLGGLLRRAAD